MLWHQVETNPALCSEVRCVSAVVQVSPSDWKVQQRQTCGQNPNQALPTLRISQPTPTTCIHQNIIDRALPASLRMCPIVMPRLPEKRASDSKIVGPTPRQQPLPSRIPDSLTMLANTLFGISGTPCSHLCIPIACDNEFVAASFSIVDKYIQVMVELLHIGVWMSRVRHICANPANTVAIESDVCEHQACGAGL
jgi:hypothetical protein